MTSRDRKLAVVVGFGGLLAAAAGVYFLVLEPLWASDAQAVKLQQEVNDLQFDLARVAKDKPRLTDTLARSLPADPTTAAVEYEATISRLLTDAQVPATSRAIKLKASELKGPPVNPAEPDAKKQTPAYTAIALEVDLTRIRYATLVEVLYRYHQLNLLHRITKFNVVRRDESGARRSSVVNNDQPDLIVKFTTTALVMDGAENRRALLPTPRALAAAAGGAGFALWQQSPAVAREQRPLQFVRVLATPDREYGSLLATDMFHGPPPPPPPPQIDPIPPPKEETAAFIRLTGIGRNPNGTGSALIEDAASRNEYSVEVTLKGGKLVPLVSKFYYTAKGAKKRLDDPDSTLDISESSSGTARLFRVVGLDDGGLVLVSREGKDEKKGPSRSGGTKVHPAAAAAGVAAVSVPNETVYVWKAGDPLTKLKGLTAREGRQAVQRATGEAAETVLTTAATEDDTGR